MFFGTDLDFLLQKLEADSIILAGVNTHACIRMSAIDAFQRDFPVFIVRECVASKDLEHHEITLGYLHRAAACVMGSASLRRRLALLKTLNGPRHLCAYVFKNTGYK